MPLITTRRGLEVIQAPIYNKGTAFSPSERERLGVRGLLPPTTLSMDQQIKKIVRGLKKMKGIVNILSKLYIFRNILINTNL